MNGYCNFAIELVASAKSHFRIYLHNLHINPDYRENARNSN